MLNELFGSRELNLTTSGGTATRIFEGEWFGWASYAPQPGDSFPGYPGLRVESVRVTPSGVQGNGFTGQEYTRCRVEVSYKCDFRKPVLGDEPRVTWDISTEVLNTGARRKWVDTEAVIDADDVSASVLYPMMNLVVDVAVDSLPLAAFTALSGCINNAEYMGCPAESLLFEGGQAQAQYHYESARWYYRMTYKFLWRAHSHNEIWRAPIVERDADGNPIYYQDKDDSKTDSYIASTDPDHSKLVNRPKLAAGQPEAGWVKTTPLLYNLADFSLLGC